MEALVRWSLPRLLPTSGALGTTGTGGRRLHSAASTDCVAGLAVFGSSGTMARLQATGTGGRRLHSAASTDGVAGLGVFGSSGTQATGTGGRRLHSAASTDGVAGFGVFGSSGTMARLQATGSCNIVAGLGSTGTSARLHGTASSSNILAGSGVFCSSGAGGPLASRPAPPSMAGFVRALRTAASNKNRGLALSGGSRVGTEEVRLAYQLVHEVRTDMRNGYMKLWEENRNNWRDWNNYRAEYNKLLYSNVATFFGILGSATVYLYPHVQGAWKREVQKQMELEERCHALLAMAEEASDQKSYNEVLEKVSNDKA